MCPIRPVFEVNVASHSSQYKVLEGAFAVELEGKCAEEALLLKPCWTEAEVTCPGGKFLGSRPFIITARGAAESDNPGYVHSNPGNTWDSVSIISHPR